MIDTIDAKSHLQALSARGPDDMDFVHLPCVFLGFTRLSINDLSSNGMQPMHDEEKSVWLICNGEIFNHKDIERDEEITPKSGSDCEVILHMYLKYRNGKESEFRKWILALDGEFAFVIYDQKRQVTLACRDRHGVRPLFKGTIGDNVIAYASEMKALTFCTSVQQVTPGTFQVVSANNVVNSHVYHDIFCKTVLCQDTIDIVLKNINSLFRRAVEKRLMSEGPYVVYSREVWIVVWFLPLLRVISHPLRSIPFQ